MAPSSKAATKPRNKNPWKRKLMVRRGRQGYDPKLFYTKDCHDDYVKFYLEGKMLDPFAIDPDKVDELGFGFVAGMMNLQQVSLLLCNTEPAYLHETCQFYANLTELDGSLYKTMVNGEELKFSWWSINEMIGCEYRTIADLDNSNGNAPFNVYNANGWPGPGFVLPGKLDWQECATAYFARPPNDRTAAHLFNLNCLTPDQRILYDAVHRILVPSGGNVTEPTSTTAILFYYVVLGRKINPGYTIVRHMVNQTKLTKQYWNLPYGGLITKMLKKHKPDFVFLSSPVPCKLYLAKYFQNRNYMLVDGKWCRKPVQEKNKRAKGNLVLTDEELIGMAEVMYDGLKEKTKRTIAVRKKIFNVMQTMTEMECALTTRGFDLPFP